MDHPQLSIIIVNYNTKDDCTKCIQSIIDKIADTTYEIIVCDNGSKDGSIDELNKRFPKEKFPQGNCLNLLLIENKENLGFGKANNTGAVRAQAGILFFINPDTVIDRGIDRMVSYMSGHKDVGALGPVVLDMDNHINLFYPPVYSNLFSQVLDLLITPAARLGMTRKKIIYTGYIEQNKVFDAGCIIGCAMMFRKEAYLLIGGFDEQVFMYGEEFDICLRLKKRGYRVQIFPEACILHYGGHSSQQATSGIMMTIGAQSLKRLLKKHFPLSWHIRYIIEALTHIRQTGSASLNTMLCFFTRKDTHAHTAAIHRHVTQFKIMWKVFTMH